MKLGYIRVSTIEQNTARQLDGIELDKRFEDKCSGSNSDRPALNQLKDYAREGDTVLVHDISRLARNIEDLINLIKFFNDKHVTIQFVKENLIFSHDLSNPINNLMLTLLGAVYQFEREMILERQKEGIAQAKLAGKYKGKPNTINRQAVWALLDQDLSIRKVAKELGISPVSVQKIKFER
ncbi:MULTISPECIES: recombinase family protein [Colwellia]|uniref:Transposase n=1 Tax=Colwellia marinimaniae TaxID=1513592 RepID=A0ABQ0MZ27_9GAMM|nr:MULTISPECIES: recombinase family protein [Colwellia]GAW97628.1 transposase [Colwellia marinimaniae]